MPHTSDSLAVKTDSESAGDMVFIPGGTFRMGSDDHYPEEAPALASPSTASGWIARP